MGRVYPEKTMGESGPDALDVRIAAASELFRCSGDIMVESHDSLDSMGPADAVIVCDMDTPIHSPPSGKYPREIAWLREMYSKGALICSVCSGSVVLAETGLFNGWEAAAHPFQRRVRRR